MRLPYNERMSRLFRATLTVGLCSALAAGCGREPAPAQQAAAPAAQPAAGTALPPPAVPLSALPKIDPAAILETTTRMSADKFQGRSPGTVGEDLTVAYLQMRFEQLGLKPGNPDGTFVQKVPLVGITGSETRPLSFTKGTEKLGMKWSDEVGRASCRERVYLCV